MKYQERLYRIACSTDLTACHVNLEESDLIIFAEKDLSSIAEIELREQRKLLKQYLKSHPDFYLSFEPSGCDETAPEIVKIMSQASFLCNVGPMATVAGAIAEVVGKYLLKFSRQVIIENGGDIFIMTEKKRVVSIFAGASPLSMKIGIELNSRKYPFGIATSSSTVGHSTSFGKADSVTVVAKTSTIADGLATYFCNLTADFDLQSIAKFFKDFPYMDGLVIIKGSEMLVQGEIKLVYTG